MTTQPDDRLWSRVYRRKDDIVAREIAGETILVPIRGTLAETQRVYTLNAVGAAVWERLDGETTLGEIREGIHSRFEAGSEEVAADLEDFIASVEGEGLAERAG